MKVAWYQKKEYWGLLGIVGAILTAIPATTVVGIAITAGVSTGFVWFGKKDGEKFETPSAVNKVINYIKN